MDFTDDWGFIGSAASEEEAKQPTVGLAPEGTAESTAPHPQPQIPSSSQIAALLKSAGLNEPESGEVIHGPGQPSTSGGLIPEGSQPAQTTANPSKKWRRPVSEALRRIGQGYEHILENQTTLSSATASSQCKSAIAVLRVDELEREKEEMQRHYDAQIKTMREAMKEQLSISKEAVSTINSLRCELAVMQAESCKWHSELRDSKVILAPPAGTSSKPAGPVAFTDTADSLTAGIARLEQQISGKIGEQPAASTSGLLKPSAPPIPPQDWSFSRLLQNAPPPHQEMHFQIRPREPPMFSGEKGQDVMVWLRQVDDYLALVNYTEK